MSLINRIVYQLKKYQFRNVQVAPVNKIIFSENSSDHWSTLFVEGMNVLDLGCGRWGITDEKETSPVFFKTKNARRIVGVDINASEIEFFQKYFAENYADDSIFTNVLIDSAGALLNLIVNHEINTIKCDIEGDEIFIFKLKLHELSSVQHIAIEYHSPLILKQLMEVNRVCWNFKIMEHSVFSEQPHMGVVILSRVHPTPQIHK